MKCLVIFLVLIGFFGFTGMAFGQYLGDKVPPNTMYDAETGKEVFPNSYADFYYSDSEFEKYSVIEGKYRYDVPYLISNGTISKASINCDDTELVLDVESAEKQDWLTLALPRYLVDSKMSGNKDDVFIVLLDSKEAHHSDISSEKLRVLVIPFSNEDSQVRIIGVNYPEHAGENACNGKHDPPFSYLLSPLKQFKSGIRTEQISCKEGLEIAIKKSNWQPLCLTPDTKEKLIQRGWAEPATIVEGEWIDKSK